MLWRRCEGYGCSFDAGECCRLADTLVKDVLSKNFGIGVDIGLLNGTMCSEKSVGGSTPA